MSGLCSCTTVKSDDRGSCRSCARALGTAVAVPALAGLANRSEWDFRVVLRPWTGQRYPERVDRMDGERHPVS